MGILQQAQLLAQDVENATIAYDETENIDGGKDRRTDDELRRMLTDTLIDNATLRKHVNSVIRCVLTTYAKSEDEDDEDQVPLRKTVLSRLLDR